MTKVQGYECNVCEAFSTNRTGWVEVKPHGVNPVPGEADTLDVCSPDCIVRLGIERGGSVKRGRPPSAAKGRPRKRYDDDFKLEVGLYALEHTDTETANRFGISFDSVRRWREETKEAVK